MPTNTRTETMRFRATKVELKLWRAAAKRRGETLSEYVRTVLGRELPALDKRAREAEEKVAELGRDLQVADEKTLEWEQRARTAEAKLAEGMERLAAIRAGVERTEGMVNRLLPVPKRAEIDVHGAATVSIVTPSGEQLQTQIIPGEEGPHLEVIVNDPRGSRDPETGISSGSARLDQDAAKKLFVAVADFAGFPEQFRQRWASMGERERMNTLSRFAFGDGALEEHPAGWSLIEQLQKIAGTLVACFPNPVGLVKDSLQQIDKLIRLAWTIDQGEDDSTLAVMVAADEWVRAVETTPADKIDMGERFRRLRAGVEAWRKAMETAPIKYTKLGEEPAKDVMPGQCPTDTDGDGNCPRHPAGCPKDASGALLLDLNDPRVEQELGTQRLETLRKLAAIAELPDDGRTVITLEFLPTSDKEIAVVAHMDGAQPIGASYVRAPEQRRHCVAAIAGQITSDEARAAGWKLP